MIFLKLTQVLFAAEQNKIKFYIYLDNLNFIQ